MDLHKAIHDLRVKERREKERLREIEESKKRSEAAKKIHEHRAVEQELNPKLKPLWQHQMDAVNKARDLDYFGLFFEVGTGKTRTLLTILDEKYQQYGFMNTLVLCPPVVIQNFKNEFKMYSDVDPSNIHTFTGPMQDRLKKFRKLMDKPFIAITNYEVLYNQPLLTEIKRWLPSVLVCDEIHKCKDPTAKRTKELIQLSDFCRFRYGLSGTPVLNSQLDLFSQIRILDGGRVFGKSYSTFRLSYFYDANIKRRGTAAYFPDFRPLPGIDKALAAKIEPFTERAKKEDVLKFLPPLVKKRFHVDMGRDQKAMYESMKKDFIAFLNSEACTAELAITKSLRLQQIVSGFVKLESGEEKSFIDCPRVDALMSMLEEIAPNKVIVWCVFKKNYEMIKNICGALKLQTCELFGDTPDKPSEIAKFQDLCGPSVMVAHPAAGGIGVNLTQASYMIYYSRGFSLEQDIQSEARNYRGGSEIHQSITRIDLISEGTIDEIVLEALDKKKKIGDGIFENAEILKMLRSKL